MRLTSSRAYTRPPPVPKMPPGLIELMEGLTREILRNNPSDVYEFCTNHMEKLLEIRDGASSKQPLNIDQKIAKAQEKIRQRAKERQERYDKEIILWSDKSKEDTNVSDQTDTDLTQKIQSFKSNEETSYPDTTDTNLTHENTIVPNLKAPVHHEQDLERASEVEISHTLSSNKIDRSTDVSKVDKPNIVKEDSNNVANENILPQKIPEENVSKKIENVVNVELGKEHETVENEDEKVTTEIEAPVVTEAIVENFTSENSANGTVTAMGVEPDILITYDNVAESSVQGKHSDELSESAKKSLDKEVDKETDIQNKTEEMHETIESYIKELDLSEATESPPCKVSATQLESNILGHAYDIKPNFVSDNIEDHNCNEKLSELLIASESQQTKNEPNETNENKSELPISPCTSDHQAMDSSDQNNIPVSTKQSADNFDRENAQELRDENIKNEEISSANKDRNSEKNNKEISTISSATVSPVTEKTIPESVSTSETCIIAEKQAEGDEVSVSKIDSNDFSRAQDQKTDALKENHGENGERQEKEESNVDNSNNDNTELFQKSDSIDNTNEDSISIVESDLSKTDDESTQNNPNNMNLETAAVTIQKVFRSFMFKSRNSTFEDTTNEENNSLDEDNEKKEEYYAAANLSKERRPLGITRMDTVLQTVNEEKSLSLSTDDSSTSAATTIQAHVRGFLVRNRFNSNKTISMNSLNSHEVLETDSEQQKNKTVLNIHIVPEDGNYLSRDESTITSMDLSLDGSPPSSINLHPMSYDISERRKMLKREDAIQSISPPSNNSGKLSEDSVKEIIINDNDVAERESTDEKINDLADQLENHDNEDIISTDRSATPTTIVNVYNIDEPPKSSMENMEIANARQGKSFTKISSDEADVITPYLPSPRSSENTSKLVHSGEFHDVVLPTKVSRNDTSAVREFKNVLVYFLLWNDS